MISDPSQRKPLAEELDWALDIAQDRLTLARQLLSRIRSVRIGRLAITWTAGVRVDPVRLRAPGLAYHDQVEVLHEARVTEAGLAVDQVLRINSMFRIVAETRFYSHDFYRQAIAKFEAGQR